MFELLDHENMGIDTILDMLAHLVFEDMYFHFSADGSN